jgi:hypothetical protein
MSIVIGRDHRGAVGMGAAEAPELVEGWHRNGAKPRKHGGHCAGENAHRAGLDGGIGE